MLANVEETSAEGYQMFVVVLSLRKTKQKKDAGNFENKLRNCCMSVSSAALAGRLFIAHYETPGAASPRCQLRCVLMPLPRSRVLLLRVHMYWLYREIIIRIHARFFAGSFVATRVRRQTAGGDAVWTCMCLRLHSCLVGCAGSLSTTHYSISGSLIVRCICPTSAWWPCESIACARVLNLP